MNPNNAILLGAISSAADVSWLTQCRQHNVGGRDPDVVRAVDRRIRDLELEKALSFGQCDNALDARIMESLRVYRAVPKHKHGKNQAAGYTERDINKFSLKATLIKAIRTGKKTDGLKNLRERGRIDGSYEQIAIDFASELPEDVVDQTRRTLAELDSENLS